MAKESYQNKKEESRGEKEKLLKPEASSFKVQFYDLWEKHSKIYEEGLSRVNIFREGAEVVEELLPICSGGRIHEGGCGDGYWMIRHLKKTKADEVIGTDLSQGMIDRAKKNLKNLDSSLSNRINLQKMDLLEEWPEGEFDIQIFQMFLCYLPHKKWKLILEKAANTTKKGGYLYDSNFIKGCDFSRTYKEHLTEVLKLNPVFYIPFLIKTRAFTKKIDTWIKEGTLEYPSREELFKHHQQLGFKIIEVREFFWGGGLVIKSQKIS